MARLFDVHTHTTTLFIGTPLLTTTTNEHLVRRVVGTGHPRETNRTIFGAVGGHLSLNEPVHADTCPPGASKCARDNFEKFMVWLRKLPDHFDDGPRRFGYLARLPCCSAPCLVIALAAATKEWRHRIRVNQPGQSTRPGYHSPWPRTIPFRGRGQRYLGIRPGSTMPPGIWIRSRQKNVPELRRVRGQRSQETRSLTFRAAASSFGLAAPV